MKYNLIQSFKNDIWTIIALFVGFFIVFFFDIQLTFLSAFITILSAYIIGDILKNIFRKHKDDSTKK